MKHLLEVFALSVKNIGTLTQMRRETNANLLYRNNLNREASFKEMFQKALVKCQTSLNKFQPSMNLKIGVYYIVTIWKPKKQKQYILLNQIYHVILY